MRIVICLFASVFFFATNVVAQIDPSPGVRVTFSTGDGKTSDTKITSTLALYVPEGQPPTEFLPAGKFRVTWSAFLRSDLRDDVSFQAEVNGTFKLEIAGTNVFEVANTKGPSAFSEPVRLKKGLNILRATFTSPISGDAYVRVNMKTSDGVVSPIDVGHISCVDSPELIRADAVNDGLGLFVEHRCARCHSADVRNGIADANMDAPSFDGIGSRLREGWVAQWIANPKSFRADAHMPQLRVATVSGNAEAMAAYLASTGKNTNEGAKLTSTESARGRSLFETEHCDVCHFTEHVGVPDAKKLPLSHVAEKFFTDALVDYLENPGAHYKWTAMPRYRLSRSDCESLARWLISQSEAVLHVSTAATPETIEHGKVLVQSAGCLNCHAMNLPNKFSTVPLAKVDVTHGGCLAGQESVYFGFGPVERRALEMWLATDHSSLSRNVPSAFAERHYARLRCAECHEKIENVPPLENLGAKLKPEWAAKFIAGQGSAKPRPWLQSQMPAFPQYAIGIAQGLAEQNGFTPSTATNPPPVAALAKVGGELVLAPPRGLACVQCHANGATQPTISDAPGINFALIATRLQPSYFQRWVRKPSAIDPHTKMPAFFSDEGKSPLTQYFNGNADMQIAAIWEYLRTRE